MLETEPTKEVMRQNDLTVNNQVSARAWHTGLSGGAPDSVRCPRLADGELAALGNQPGDVAKIHRTERWCTGLSSESSAPAPEVFGDELVALGKRKGRHG